MLEASRGLEELPIEKESFAVQERVLKAASLTGLFHLAMRLLDSMLEKGHLPSSVAYIALCNGLRKARRIHQLEELLYKLGDHKTADEPISVFAVTIFLSALSDEIAFIRKRTHNGRRHVETLMDKALDWLDHRALSVLGAQPSDESYATVLATVENITLAQTLWNQLIEKGLQPSIYTYNNYLKAILKNPKNETLADEEALKLLRALEKDPQVQHNRYTVVLLTMTLLRTGRKTEWEQLVDDLFVEHANDPDIIAEIFSSLLDTLVKGNQIGIARNIFDFYLAPSLARHEETNERKRVQVIHFNVLLSGYRKCLADCGADIKRGTHFAQVQGMHLYESLIQSGMNPDYYTLGSMCGLVHNTEKLSKLLKNAVVDMDVQVNSVVPAAALAAYGTLRDPSSACWLFDALFAGGAAKSTRTITALMGALSKGATTSSAAVLSPQNSVAARTFGSDFPQVSGSFKIASAVDGMTCSEAAKKILDMMRQGGGSVKPDAATFCCAATAIQQEYANKEVGMELYRSAIHFGIRFDGRFVNALFHCFGDDVDAAMDVWKGGVRKACFADETSQKSRTKKLLASYHGLLHVCGRALRPDIAVRIVYAMGKENVPVNEMALKCYLSGKRRRPDGGHSNLAFSQQYEDILSVECTRYDSKDARRQGEKRVRIIL